MSILRLTGSTSGYSQITPPAIAGDQTFTLPGTGGTLDRLNRAGNILQVVQATTTTSTAITATSFADTSLSASITPTSSTSKILVCVTQRVLVTNTANNVGGAMQLLRGTTSIFSATSGANYNGFFAINAGLGDSSTLYMSSLVSFKYLDSPATSSSVTYKTQARVASAGTILFQGNNDTGVMILMEVAA